VTWLRWPALVLRFLLELAGLAAYVYIGVATVDGAGGVVLGIVLAAIGITVWSLFVAPRARIVLPVPARLAIETVFFVLAALGLVLNGQATLGIVLVGLWLLDRLALLAGGAPPFEPAGPPRRDVG
jgi:hypothetical protein